MQWNQSIPDEVGERAKAWAERNGMTKGRMTELALTLVQMIPDSMRTRLISGSVVDRQSVQRQLDSLESMADPVIVQEVLDDIRARAARRSRKRRPDTRGTSP